jgi:outer membrane protein assembly factor BamB
MLIPKELSMKLRRILSNLLLWLCLFSLLAPALPTQAANQQSDPSQETVPADVDNGDWYMAGANPQRTSWVSEEVRGKLNVDWYRPIEAYIDQKVQIITAYENLYLSTSRGLYVLKAATGDVVWRYDTEMPLGHSPTVIGGKVYVGGYDKKLHALDAFTGAKIWEFTGAGAGFSVNPLVIEGKVYAGNRDGYFYAVDAETGQLVWQYPPVDQPPLGPIKFSAAYADGIVYFVSTDMHAYALSAGSGALLWRSPKLPGESFQSWWPVIYRDKVIFSASPSYRIADPGIRSMVNAEGQDYTDLVNGVERDDIFPPESNPVKDQLIGPTFESSGQNGEWDWAPGTTVMDAHLVTEYFEDDGVIRLERRTNKPWRRTYHVLNRSDGSEFTFDSDNDGHPEYAPVLYYGSKNGSAYPPIVMPDDVIYQNNHFVYRGWISGGQIMGWKLGTQYVTLSKGKSAVDEPQAISGGGNIIYRNLCCDRVAEASTDIQDPKFKSISYWGYLDTLAEKAPGYDSMWVIQPGLPRLIGNYRGKYGSVSGMYHNHGDQNPPIPYEGKVYAHRSNAIIALASEGSARQLPLLEVAQTKETIPVPGAADLSARLEREVAKMVQAGRLRPGYYNDGTPYFQQFWDYFENPGDTLYTLAIAYPYLSPTLQEQVKTYLREEYDAYFGDMMVGQIGWDIGAAREYMDLPPEVVQDLPSFGATEWAGHNWPWKYPQHNFYALWKYVEIFPEMAGEVYQKAKGKLQVPIPVDNADLADFPWEHNGYIVGYIGFLKLQELAGKTQEDSALHTKVQTELDRLLELRATQFDKDTPWTFEREDGKYVNRRKFNVAGNFIWLVPELSDYLHEHALAKVEEAVNEYNYVAPFWFVASTENTFRESVRHHLYDYYAIFQAKAQILREPQAELYQYLDVPAFKVGDLFYIQNLVALIRANPIPRAAAPSIVPAGGLFTDPVTVELVSAQSGAQIYYTLDGSEVSTVSQLYTVPFVLSTSATIKARSIIEGQQPSYTASTTFIIGDFQQIYLPQIQGSK